MSYMRSLGLLLAMLCLGLMGAGSAHAAEVMSLDELNAFRGGTPWFEDDDCTPLAAGTSSCAATVGCAVGGGGGQPCSICTTEVDEACKTTPAYAPDLFRCKNVTQGPGGTYIPIVKHCDRSGSGRCVGNNNCGLQPGVPGLPACGDAPSCAD